MRAERRSAADWLRDGEGGYHGDDGDDAAAVDDDAALGNLQFTHGNVAGNIVQFTSSKVDIGDVSYGDSDGIAMLEIPYTCVPDAAANAEFDLIYT